MNLSKAQKQIYDLERYIGNSVAVICTALFVDGTQSVDAMCAAVHEMFRSNDALRFRMKKDGTQLQQYVSEYTEQKIEVLSFSDRETFDAFAQKHAQKPIDPAGSLCDIKVFVLPGQYGLLVKIHHLIADAWSVSLLASQFISILNGNDVKRFSYCAYLENEKRYLAGKRYEKDKQYFTERYKQFEEPVYIRKKTTDSYEAVRLIQTLSPAETAKLKNFCELRDCSPFTVFLTAFAVYLSRINGNAAQVCVGTTVLNRSGEQDMNTIGMFVNTIALLLGIDETKSFYDALLHTEDVLFSTFRHQKYNYSDLQADAAVNAPLFDVIVNYMNASIAGDGAQFSSAWYHSGFQNESLVISFDDRDGKDLFTVHYDYRVQIFSENDIKKIHACLLAFLSVAIDNADNGLCTIGTLPQDEKKSIVEFNSTSADYPKDKCVHELFEEQAARTPDKTAVVAVDKTLTYRELNEEANRIANALIAKGIGKGDIVGLMLPRKSYLLAALFGILKTGAAYLPVDPDHPEDRVKYMLSDSEAKFCITEENISLLLCHENIYNPIRDVQSADICYCIYTSGSTGKPKGTLLTHRNIVNYVSVNEKNVLCGITGQNAAGILSVTTIGFDIFVTESLLPLVNGMQIILADEEQSRNQSRLRALLQQHPAEILQTTPTKMKTFTADPSQADYLQNFKAIILGGEALDTATVEELKKHTTAKIYNIYGPTETTVWVSWAQLDNAQDITIGKPMANVQIHIVDKYMNLVPIGVKGELCIAGDCVCAGYLNRPELTAEKFIDNPFGEGKLYKTGDLAYWREDGNIVFVGRNDFQVKIRGLRIELGEIEKAITAVDGIVSGVVVVRKDAEDRQLLCAFYTGEEKNAKELRSALSASLPKYMVPHVFMHLEAMPMTTSGKIDRKALPEIDLANITTETEYVAPVTENEVLLVDCIKDVLGVEKVSVLDNFFDIGGDSLKSIELTARLEAKGYTVSVKTIFASKDIASLATELIPMDEEEETVSYGNVLPATAAQMRVYTAQVMHADATHYNISFAIKVKDLHTERLEKALNKLVERHESLRTRFESRDGQIVQVIEESAAIRVEQIESEDISLFNTPFDLTKLPLIRAGYCRNTVMIILHHIIADGESVSVFFKELNELYMGRELSDTVQYGSFAINDRYTSESEQYWLQVFKEEIVSTDLPVDFERPAVQSVKGSQIYAPIDKQLHNQITEKCKQLNITPFVFYMACYNILLSKLTGNEDIVVGMPISGRTSRFLKTMGMFVNTIALRSTPEGNKTVLELLLQIRKSSVEAIDNQNYPFGELIKNLNLHSSNRNPIFDVMFAYQSEQLTNIVFADYEALVMPVTLGGAKCDLNFNILPRSTDTVLLAEYCTDLFRKETVQKWISFYKNILSQALDETKYIRDVEILSAEEKQKVLVDFNDTAFDYDRDKCVYQLFEEQVAKNPDKTAVIFKEKHLSYKQLELLVQSYANKLKHRGINEGDVVAILLERSHKLIAFQLAVLKTGAIFLPLDKRYPAERIKYACEDCNVKLLVTDEPFNTEIGTDVVDIIDFEAIAAQEKAATVCNNNECYIIYTSGSTGTPKGCLLTGKGLLNFCVNNNTLATLNEQENCIFACVNSVSFDYFIAESLLPLTNGFSTVIFDDNESSIQKYFTTVAEKNNVNVLMTTPTRLKIYFDDKINSDVLKQMRCICTSGEPLTDDLLAKMYKKSPEAKVYNPIGPSECSVWDMGGELNREDGIDIHIGKPIANAQIYITDQYLNPVPIGVTGEICIAGDGVGAGYINRPELTAEKFVDNPFGAGKLYKTGDLAYWREDGNIVFVGRNDFQVKIRGLRIELGEIEKAITAVDGVVSGVVVVRKDKMDGQLICAFYTGEEKSAKELRAEIGKRLPKYMIPHIFMYLENLPMTTSGKVNRNALPAPDLENIVTDTEYEAPINETEKYICDAFMKILDIEQVGRKTDFFEVGATSLSVISLLAEKGFENVSVAEIMNHSTPEKLAALMNCRFRSRYDYLEPLHISDQANKSLILLPFAGGGAESFSGFVNEIKLKYKNISIYFIRFLHSDYECEKAAQEIREILSDHEVTVYSHCAGAAVAMKIISKLENAGFDIKHYYAGAIIPTENASDENEWKNVPDFALKHILNKSGAKLNKLSQENCRQILQKFRQDTDFANRVFFETEKKIKTPVTVIISKKDYFTRNYKQAEKCWCLYAENVDDIRFIDSKSHYFQSDNASELIQMTDL